MIKKYLKAGKFVTTHGVRGALKAECWCDSPQVLASLKNIYISSGGIYRKIEVTGASVFKRMVILTLEGCSDIDSALRYRNVIFYADRDELPLAEGAHFIEDLIGLPVIDADTGERYGELNDVILGAASDIYEIRMNCGKLAMMPAVSEYVAAVDTEKGIFIRPIEGMLDC